jgi:hypothetical protein
LPNYFAQSLLFRKVAQPAEAASIDSTPLNGCIEIALLRQADTVGSTPWRQLSCLPVCRSPRFKLLCDRRVGPARRSRDEGGLSLKLLYGAGPRLLLDDSTSQSPDPILKALYLHHNHTGIVSAVRHCSHTLKGAKEMHREFS